MFYNLGARVKEKMNLSAETERVTYIQLTQNFDILISLMIFGNMCIFVFWYIFLFFFSACPEFGPGVDNPLMPR